MLLDIRLTPAVAEALAKAANLVSHAPQVAEIDPVFVALLEAGEASLLRQGTLCSHCHAEPRRSTSGLCSRCDSYQRADARRRGVDPALGSLPTHQVLRRRALR